MKFGESSNNKDDMSATDWVLERSRTLSATDMFAARSWLLTAKSMFPKSFAVQYEAYHLEYSEKNAEQCASLLEQMFQDFPSSNGIWNEVESLIFALEGKEKGDRFKQEIFSRLPSQVQQSMMVSAAERKPSIAEQCKLMMVLMEKFPETVAQYGVLLAEKLTEEEKAEGSGSPLNQPRRILVCEVLPIICKSPNVEVSRKHFYKWIQKSAEFYATFFTTPSKIREIRVGKIQKTWEDVEKLRRLISVQCEWEEPSGESSKLLDRMNHIKDLHRRSRTDVTGSINKKQIFYTTILLLFESAIKYMKVLEPCIYEDSQVSDNKSQIIVLDWEAQSEENMEGPSAAKKKKVEKTEEFAVNSSNSELKEAFLVARDAWNILHSSDSFDKDFGHLGRRWKIERWIWLQLFLCDYYTHERIHKSALSRINNLMEQDMSKFPSQVVLRCHCQVVASYYANDHLLMAFQSIMESLGHLPQPSYHTPLRPNYLRVKPDPQRPFRLISLEFSCLLPFWIQIFIQSFMKITALEDQDTVLGHVMILAQYEWPRWQKECKNALDIISKKKKYVYTLFFDYMICIDILEEIAYLRNNCSCELVLLPDSKNHQRVTRGVNKGANEDFIKAMKRQIRKSEESLELVLWKFLSQQQDSLLNCVQSQHAQEILEPMDIDI